jgi:hypothetical protein
LQKKLKRKNPRMKSNILMKVNKLKNKRKKRIKKRMNNKRKKKKIIRVKKMKK